MARGRDRWWSGAPWWAWAAFVLAAVFLVVGLPLASGRGQLTAAEAARLQAEGEATQARWAAEIEAERPRRVAFVGDSYTGGANSFGERENGWPRIVSEQFGWRPVGDDRVLFSVGGTGYVNPGPTAEDQRFITRLDAVVASDPDIVIVAGGINDAEYYPTAEIGAAATEFLTGLRQRLPDAAVVVVGPFYPREAPRQWVAAREVIFDAAAAVGAPTIDPLPWFTGPDAVEISDDGTHPTDVGHAQIARHMIEELGRIDLPKAQGT